jgi:hypothetical protein
MTLGVPPATEPARTQSQAWFRRPLVLGLAALLLMTGAAALVAHLLESQEPAAAHSPAVAPASAPASAAQAAESAVPAAASGADPSAAPNTEAAAPASAPAVVPEAPATVPSAPASAASAAPPSAPPRTARKTVDNTRHQPVASVEAPAPAPAVSEKARLRCSQIMQKAGVGEPLSSEEKKELANSCR